MSEPPLATLYGGLNNRFTRWDLAQDGCTLVERGVLDLPAQVQYAWPRRAGDVWYVATSDSAGRAGPPGTAHHVSAVSTSRGALQLLGEPRSLPSRPIHLSVDPFDRWVLIAFSRHPSVRSYALDDAGALGEHIDTVTGVGSYPHQVLTTPDGSRALVTSLGHNATEAVPEEPGAITTFDLVEGVLSRPRLTAPHGGYGFGPRHLDIHPNGRWVYVSLERQNEFALFDLGDEGLSPEPRQVVDLLQSAVVCREQKAGAVHIHPRGHVVYVVNRSSPGRLPKDGVRDDSIVVFALLADGAMTERQRIDSGGIHCRTFHIDPSGSFLVAGHVGPAGAPAGVSVFEIDDDGLLRFVARDTVGIGDETLFWLGMQHPGRGTHANQKRKQDQVMSKTLMKG